MIKLFLLSFIGLFGTSSGNDGVDKLHEECYGLFSSDIDAAYEIAQEAYNLSEVENYQYGQAHSLYIMAYCNDENNKLNKAVPQYLSALDLYESIDTEKSRRNQAEVYLNLGRIFRIHYKYEDAINFYERGLKISGDIGNKGLMRKLLHNMSIAYRHKGDLVKAAEVQFEKLSITEEDDNKSKIKAYNQLGLIHRDLNQYDEARNYLNHLLKIESEKKVSRYRASALLNIGNTYLAQENLVQAEKYYLMSLDESIKLGKNKYLFNIYATLTELSIKQSNFNNAELYGLKSLALLKDVSLNVENNKINHYLSDVYFAKNHPSKAKHHFDSYVENMESLYEQQKELASQGDQYKIELITSTYFAKIQEKEKFNYYMIAIGMAVFLFLAFVAYTRYRKVAATKMLREHFSSISFNIGNEKASS